ncbi:retrovirus-related Pol polyprotein from transposon opus [Trichonephila clavipes]|nr:retrovirus-related Pol polyprotein from transposon opus [Trichonephila clavipes]
MRGSRNSDNVERRGWNERMMSNADDSRKNGRNSEVLRRPNNGRNDYRDQPGLTHVLYHEIDTGGKPSVVSRPYCYDRVKQAILDYHVKKMLKEGNIIPIQSPYASPVALCRKNNGLPPDNPEAYRFAVDYRKLNSITKYPRYPLPLIDDLITNIPHTTIISSLYLRLGYFQLAVYPSDIVKTMFATKNGTYAFRRMLFGLSGPVPNFQKVIDIILKPVIGKFVSVYMDDVIISSPSFTHHVEHLREVFGLLPEAELTLNKAKGKFGCDELKYLGLIIRKEGIKTDETKVRSIVEMKSPRNSKEVSKFLGSPPVKVITDQAALARLTNGKNLSSRMIRWVLKLAEFNTEWEHRSGIQNVVADVLSRNPVESII